MQLINVILGIFNLNNKNFYFQRFTVKHVVEGNDGTVQPPPQDYYFCEICQKKYKFEGALNNNLTKKHTSNNQTKVWTSRLLVMNQMWISCDVTPKLCWDSTWFWEISMIVSGRVMVSVLWIHIDLPYYLVLRP